MEKSHRSVLALPETPGVYLFMGLRHEVLYVGKATSLRDRVRSYFARDLAQARGVHIVEMVHRARRVEFRATDSVLEALVLEAHLIKEFKPRYNTRDKDDKSFNYLIITTNETWPRLFTVRGKDRERMLSQLAAGGETSSHALGAASPSRRVARGRGAELPVYGPFVHAGQFKEALKLLRGIFPYFDTKHPVDVLMAKHDKRLAFNRAIGVYPAEHVTTATYRATVRHIRLFFEGRKPSLVRSLERAMHRAAVKREFELAGEYKRQLAALAHIRDISLLKREPATDRAEMRVRIEAYDVAHQSGAHMIGVCVALENGEPDKLGYRTFTVRGIERANDTAALAQVLTRRLAHSEWPLPDLFVVDGGAAQLNVAGKVLEAHGYRIPVVAVTKDEHHRPREIRGDRAWARRAHEDILRANAEAHRFAVTTFRRRARTRALP